ncbi:hypothetical protein JST97_32035 [bacterium]|nr:hypothetical protein [bacterium]
MRFRVRSARYSLAIVLAMSLYSGCGSSSAGLSDSGFGGGSQSTRILARTYTGTVHLDKSADRVEVQVLAPDSDIVLARAITNGAGIFQLPEGLSLPGRFRVSALTPEGVRVERMVDPGELPHLWINIPSHLISLFIRRHPEVTVVQAESALRRALAMSEGEGLYGTSSLHNSPFSHRLFLRAVQNSGLGFEGYCAKLLTDLENGGGASFRPPVSNAFGKVSAGRKLVGFLAEEVGSKLFDSTVEFSVGKIAGATGFHIGTQAEFDEINAKLDEISQQISDLTVAVNTGFLNGLIALRSQSVKDVVSNLGIAQDALSAQAQATSQSYSLEPNVYDHGPAVVPTQTTTLIQSFDFFVKRKALDVFTDSLTSSDRNVNVLTIANQKARQELNIADTTGTEYDLRRDDLTDKLESNFELFVGYCTQLANVASEDATSRYLPQGLSVSGFIAPSGPVNQALGDIVRAARILFEGHQQVAESVGCDRVLIDREHKLMWYLNAQLCQYDVAQNGMIGLEVNNWRLPPGVAPPSPLASQTASGFFQYSSFNNFRRSEFLPGWRLPERSELELLYKRVEALGGGDKNPEKTLVALKKLGFTGLSEDASENYKKFWYNGSVFTDIFHEYDMSKNEDGIELHAFGTNPSYTAIYVRTLDYNAPAFGDTVDQFHKGYGLGLKSIYFGAVNPHDNGKFFLREVYLLGEAEGPVGNLPYPSNMSDRAVWTLENMSPPDCAFLTFRDDPNTTIASVHFRGPGTATVRATISQPISATCSQTYSTNVKPELQSIMISPQNLALQTVPETPAFHQFYCTGYLPTGETVDLTNLVNWSILTPTSYQGNNPTRITSGVPTGGDLIFGERGSLPSSSNITIQAVYRAGSVDAGAMWTDGGKSFTGTSVFHVP